jgi:hypothetical protein
MGTSDEDDEVNIQTRKTQETVKGMGSEGSLTVEYKNTVQQDKLIRRK